MKYCFRYNARNRAALAAQGDAEDPINLENVNPRPRRRRREKKLMTMDETNERFPLVKYKTWVESRAQEGLPREGGVAAPPGSRPATLRNAEGVLPASPTETKHSIEFRDRTGVAPEDNGQPTTTHEAATPIPMSYYGATAEARRSIDRNEKPTSDGQPQLPTLEEVNTNNTHDPKNPDHHDDDASDDDDHILTALSPDVLDHPGDSCAICIDTLEDNDDVRGLTCGHAFHASCLDPWLTSRRACCPLCKADYYIPKPRAEGAAEAAPGESRSRRRERVNMPQQPRNAWMGIRGHPRIYIFPGRFVGRPAHAPDPLEHPSERSRRERRARAQEQVETQEAQSQRGTGQSGESGFARFAGRLNPWRRGAEAQGQQNPAEVTPAQLEAQVVR